MRVAIIGPNLRSEHQRLGDFHVHAEGCADIARKYRGDTMQVADVKSLDEAVTLTYDPGDFEYDPATEIGKFSGGFHVAPCVKWE
jgi:hypothetical protein